MSRECRKQTCITGGHSDVLVTVDIKVDAFLAFVADRLRCEVSGTIRGRNKPHFPSGKRKALQLAAQDRLLLPARAFA
jgi:hypothetical protein